MENNQVTERKSYPFTDLDDTSFHTDALYGKPEGTCEWIGGDRWLVKGKTRTYCLDVGQWDCTCPDHQCRRVPGEDCKHLATLRAHRERLGITERPKAVELTDEQLREIFR